MSHGGWCHQGTLGQGKVQTQGPGHIPQTPTCPPPPAHRARPLLGRQGTDLGKGRDVLVCPPHHTGRSWPPPGQGSVPAQQMGIGHWARGLATSLCWVKNGGWKIKKKNAHHHSHLPENPAENTAYQQRVTEGKEIQMFSV